MNDKNLKLNIGCGFDYKQGWVNIDGHPSVRSDLNINIETESLREHFAPHGCSEILARDIMEHVPRYVAVRLLGEFFAILDHGGKLTIATIDAQAVIESTMSIEQKITYLFGGQDLPMDNNADKNRNRASHPEFFCHKYCWTRKALLTEMRRVGFTVIGNAIPAGVNFIAEGKKP